MLSDIYLSIVVPAYKEEERIHLILEAIEKYQTQADFNLETIIVIDGSPDQTAEMAKKYDKVKNLSIIDRHQNKGKGYSVREGVMAAKGKYVLFADADNSTPVEQVSKLLKYVNKYDVVIGSRYNHGGHEDKPQPISRIIGSRGLNLLIQFLAVYGIKDTQCGFKLFESHAAKEIFKRQTFDRFSFDIEILAIAKQLGYKIYEAGIIWYDNPHSTVNPLRDGLRMVRDAWQVRKNIMTAKYK